MKIGEKEKIGDKFQEYTKYKPDEMTNEGLDWDHEPETYKIYSDKEEILLPEVIFEKDVNPFTILNQRRSVRAYSDKPLNLSELSSLLWIATGITKETKYTAFRTAPSAGALYPIETYIVVNKMIDLKSGIYHYNIRDHKLDVIKIGEFGDDLADAALGQAMCSKAAVVFVFTAIFQRSKWKYRQRAYRYIYMEAGHISQNLAIGIESLGFGGCHIAAFFDDMVNELLDVDGKEESAIYMTTIGHKKRAA